VRARGWGFLAVVGATLVTVLGAFAYFVVHKHIWAVDRLDTLGPRYARLAGLQTQQVQLEAAEQHLRSLLTKLTYLPAQDVSQAGNDAQQRIRTLLSQSGLEVVSSQVLAPKVDRLFDRVPLVVRTEGDLIGLQSALMVLTNQSPAILMDGLTVQVVGSAKADAPQRLSAQLSLSVLRIRP
jgi:general secretion pathway protein M